MTSRRIFDLPSKKREMAAIEQESIAPDFYGDRAHSQRQMRRLSYLRDEVTTWEGLSTRLSDLEELSQMVAEGGVRLHPDTAIQIAAEQERRSRPTRIALIAVLGVIALALVLALQRFL